MKKMFFMLFIITAFCNAQPHQAPKPGKRPQTIIATVVKVKDGDTVVVLDSEKNEIVIRLAGVDAPEISQPFGKVSKQFTISQVALKEVTITLESKDRYGRNVGWITYDRNKNLSEELLKVGLAWHYIKYDKSIYYGSFAILQKLAIENKKGLWADAFPIKPEDWRKGIRVYKKA